jgi:SNF2 family DNA or RNA helicase
VKRADATQYIKDFNEGRLPMLLGHPQSVAHGLNLQANAHHVVFYALPWSLEYYIQSIRRIWRQGQKNPVTVYRILAADTVDQSIAAGLERKDGVQKALFKALEERYGKRKTT